jgi:hypothetical protein
MFMKEIHIDFMMYHRLIEAAIYFAEVQTGRKIYWNQDC